MWRRSTDRRRSRHRRCGSCAVLSWHAFVTILRHDPARLDLTYLRLVTCGYALFGAVAAPWLTWGRLRAYVIGVSFVLPLLAAYVVALLGNRLTDLPLSALATFVPLAFHVTAWDLLVSVVGLLVGHAVLLTVFPSPDMPAITLYIVMGGAIRYGAVGVMILFYRSSLREASPGSRRRCAAGEFLNTMSHELRSPLLRSSAMRITEEAATPRQGFWRRGCGRSRRASALVETP
jgi:hypothetical protein